MWCCSPFACRWSKTRSWITAEHTHNESASMSVRPYYKQRPLVRVNVEFTVKRRIRVPQTVTYGVFDREFDFDSQEWSCSVNFDSQAWGCSHTSQGQRIGPIRPCGTVLPASYCEFDRGFHPMQRLGAPASSEIDCDFVSVPSQWGCSCPPPPLSNLPSFTPLPLHAPFVHSRPARSGRMQMQPLYCRHRASSRLCLEAPMSQPSRRAVWPPWHLPTLPRLLCDQIQSRHSRLHPAAAVAVDRAGRSTSSRTQARRAVTELFLN